MPETPQTDGSKGGAVELKEPIAHLRAGLRPDGTYEGVGEWDVVTHQWQSLGRWVRSKGLIVSSDPEKEGGREHDVTFDPKTDRWFKFTKPWAAGYIVHLIEGRLVMTPATPLEYLERWATHNSVFGDDVMFHGIKETQSGNRLVISQRHVPGVDASWEQIENAFVTEAKMLRLPLQEDLGGYKACAYFRGRIGIFDVRPLNCVFTPENCAVAAIDVIPRFFNQKDAAVLRAMCTQL